MHVDDFIEDPKQPPYSRWLLLHFRLPAFQWLAFEPFMREHKLFCNYQGDRYRCIGASRFGDVWLTSDFSRSEGYGLRVDVAACSNWSPTP